MKKILVALFVLVIMTSTLSSCALAPRGTLTDAFGSGENLKYVNGVSFQLVQYHKNSLDVLIDGKPYTLTDPKNNSYLVLATKNAVGEYNFWYKTKLLDEFTWKNNGSGEFVAFKEQGNLASTGSVGEGYDVLVLFPKELMPKLVDHQSWNDTKATLCALEYPGYLRFVQNLSTGEVTKVSGWLETIDDNLNSFDVIGGQCLYGYVKISNGSIYVTSTQPDNAKMAMAYDKAVQIFGVGNVSDPVEACQDISVYSVMVKYSITKEQILDWCGVYTPSQIIKW